MLCGNLRDCFCLRHYSCRGARSQTLRPIKANNRTGRLPQERLLRPTTLCLPIWVTQTDHTTSLVTSMQQPRLSVGGELSHSPPGGPKNWAQTRLSSCSKEPNTRAPSVQPIPPPLRMSPAHLLEIPSPAPALLTRQALPSQCRCFSGRLRSS
jgi:hypothetical protein